MSKNLQQPTFKNILKYPGTTVCLPNQSNITYKCNIHEGTIFSRLNVLKGGVENRPLRFMFKV